MNREYNIEGSECAFCNDHKYPQMKPLSDERLNSFRSVSEHHQENLREIIQELRQDNVTIVFHSYCVSTYKSNTHINRYFKKKQHYEERKVSDTKTSR